MEEVDELALLLNTVIKPLPLSQEEISLSELYYQALRLHYYCSQLFRLLGFTEDSTLNTLRVREIIDQVPDNPYILYFTYKHNLFPNINKKELLKKAADNPNELSFNILSLKAQYHLGKLYEKGDQEIKANIYKALNWYEKSLKKAESFSTIYIGIKEGSAARKVYAKIFYRRGMIELEGRTLAEEDIERACDQILKAAEQGYAKAQHQLGLLYYLGFIQPTNDSYCLQKWHQGKQGDCFNIAERPRPLPASCRQTWMDHKALFWWGHAAAQNQRDAHFYLSWMYKQGYGVLRSQEKAQKYYKKGSAQGEIPPWERKEAYINKATYELTLASKENILVCLMMGLFYHMREKPEEAIQLYKKIGGFQVAYGISRILSQNFPIKELKLIGRKISNRGTEHLANALQENQNLTSLSLGNNQITSSGAQALALALANNTTLISLNLGNNYESSKVRSLPLISTYASLVPLASSFVPFVGPLVQAVFPVIEHEIVHNFTTEFVIFNHNHIEDAGAQALALALKHNTTLTSLDLRNNSISDAEKQHFESLTNLKKLYF